MQTTQKRKCLDQTSTGFSLYLSSTSLGLESSFQSTFRVGCWSQSNRLQCSSGPSRNRNLTPCWRKWTARWLWQLPWVQWSLTWPHYYRTLTWTRFHWQQSWSILAARCSRRSFGLKLRNEIKSKLEVAPGLRWWYFFRQPFKLLRHKTALLCQRTLGSIFRQNETRNPQTTKLWGIKSLDPLWRFEFRTQL